MATVGAEATSQPTHGKYDRVFYSGMAIGMALTVLIGFGPTYYTKVFGHVPLSTLSGGPMTPLVHTHGVLFTAWVLLFIVETALVAQHRVAIHRRIGIAGVLPLGPLAFFGLAFVFILVGITYDIVSRHRVHPVYIWGGGVLALSVPLRLAVSRTDAWKSFAESLTTLVF